MSRHDPPTLLLVGSLLLASGSLHSSADPAELEQELDQLRARIEHIQNRLDADLARRDEGLRALAESERALAATEQEQRRTRQQLVQTEASMDRLQERIDDTTEAASDLAEQLAAQLRIAYRQGTPSRLQLVLNQDDPRQLSRHLAYHGHLSRVRIELITELHQLNESLEIDRQALQAQTQALRELQLQQTATAERIEQERADRDRALARLEERIVSQNQQIAALQRDAEELESLLDELARALRDIPMDVEVPSILQLAGQLPMPLNGEVIRNFGEPRGGEVRWTGWLLAAEAGAEVHAIAHGRVAYSDWLRGYGMLTIIDHGDGIMSLYGHNESLSRGVGAWVEPGDVLATVGRSGGADRDALYFEIRENGQAVDPAIWLAAP